MKSVAAVVVLSGCSLTFVPSVASTPASSREEVVAEAATCNPSRSWPLADLLVGALVGGLGSVAYRHGTPHEECSRSSIFDDYTCHTTTRHDDYRYAGMAGVAVGSAEIVVAIIGYLRTNDCRAIKDAALRAQQ